MAFHGAWTLCLTRASVSGFWRRRQQSTRLDVASLSLHPGQHLSLWFLWQREHERFPIGWRLQGLPGNLEREGNPLLYCSKYLLSTYCTPWTVLGDVGSMKRMLDPYSWGALWFQQFRESGSRQNKVQNENMGSPVQKQGKMLLKVLNRKSFPFFSLSWFNRV